MDVKRVSIVVGPGFHNKGGASIFYGLFKTLQGLNHDIEVVLPSEHPKYDALRCKEEILNRLPLKVKVKVLKTHIIPHLRALAAILLSILWRALHIETNGAIGKELKEVYFKADLTIVGTNGIFSTQHGSRNFFLNFYPILIAKILGKPVVIYAASIEPLKRRFKLLGFLAFNLVDLITLREARSYEYLRRLNVRRPLTVLTADLAFLLDPISVEQANRLLFSKIKVDRKNVFLVGVAPSSLVPSLGAPHLKSYSSRYHEYIKTLAELIDYLIDKYSATIALVAHARRMVYEGDDRSVCEDIYHLVKRKESVFFLNKEEDLTAAELKGIFRLFDAFIGSRTHAVINALSEKVPSIFITDRTHKSDIITNMLGQSKWVLYGLPTAPILKSMVDSLMMKRDEIKTELNSKILRSKKLALRNGELLKLLISGCKVRLVSG
ncbi:MAG: polysaccharide pyruvyl transferase family protein [Candidatus Nezhaarchaeales archaeon]